MILIQRSRWSLTWRFHTTERWDAWYLQRLMLFVYHLSTNNINYKPGPGLLLRSRSRSRTWLGPDLDWTWPGTWTGTWAWQQLTLSKVKFCLLQLSAILWRGTDTNSAASYGQGSQILKVASACIKYLPNYRFHWFYNNDMTLELWTDCQSLSAIFH